MLTKGVVMKKLIVLVLALTTFSVMAQEKPNIEKAKARALEYIAKRQANLDAHKSCISAATTKDALKACRKANKERNMAMRNERKAMRQQRKEARKNRKKNQ